MKTLIIENMPTTFMAIKEVIETLSDIDVYPKSMTENYDLISDINRHDSNNNNYDKILANHNEIDLFIIDIYLSRQNERERNGISFCEYLLENKDKINNKNPYVFFISNGTVKNYQIPSGDNILFFDKEKEGAFLYEVIRKKIQELFDLSE